MSLPKVMLSTYPARNGDCTVWLVDEGTDFYDVGHCYMGEGYFRLYLIPQGVSLIERMSSNATH